MLIFEDYLMFTRDWKKIAALESIKLHARAQYSKRGKYSITDSEAESIYDKIQEMKALSVLSKEVEKSVYESVLFNI